MNNITPIFLFSPPRSGSTLLQRMIAAHDEVATESEGWLLLPLFYLTRGEAFFAEYGGHLAKIGIAELFNRIPEGEDLYRKNVADMAVQLFSKLARNKEKYFLEKTPRYHLIVNEIIESFPNAKFIFLWRNPLSIVSSIISTWGGGRWNLYRNKIDLYRGMENLTEAFEKNKSRALGVQYEALIRDTDEQMKRIMDYLELSPDKYNKNNFLNIKLSGTWGDPTGTREYREISTEPLEKWKTSLNSPFRKYWCRRYLGWIGNNRLNTMGYDLQHLQRELSGIKTTPRLIISDLARMLYGLVFAFIDIPILRSKMKMLRKRQRIYPLS